MLEFCCFGLLATKTCLDCKHDKIRHLEIVDVLIYAYGLLVGRKGSSFFGMDGLKKLAQPGHSAGACLKPL